MWRFIKSISNNSENQSAILPNTLNINNVNVSGKQIVANELNNHSVNISHIIKKTVFKPENFEHLKCFLDEKLGNRDFKIEYISPAEVLTLIDKLNPNKRSGLDRIGPYTIKFCKDYIVQPLIT